MPFGRDCFGGAKGYDSVVVDRFVEDAPVADDDGHDEERAREISPEGDEPVQQHFPGRNSAVQGGDGRELFTEHEDSVSSWNDFL